jgi:hypothetical protein
MVKFFFALCQNRVQPFCLEGSFKDETLKPRGKNEKIVSGGSS